ncbi:MAG TPA: hypothetical protein VGV16_07970 [Gammaproteobacteria bacterium]|nr:hypothetical protein [Gammaproteobacteria bacterium]
MEPGDALSKGAQIAVAFVGLTGVVVVRRGAAVHAWPQADKFRLKLLLTTSLLPLALCLLGLLLLAADLPAAVVWRWCSGVAALVLFVGSLLFSRTFLRIPGRELKRVEASKAIFWSFSAVGFAFCLLLVYNVAILDRFWPFFTFVVCALLVTLVQFIRFILTRSVHT